MTTLKLFMEDFDPEKGLISYAVEDDTGARVARAEYVDESIKNYSPKTMDFFLLGFLPKLMRLGMDLEVRGPVSKNLMDDLFFFQAFIKTYKNHLRSSKIITWQETKDIVRNYDIEDIEHFESVYSDTKDLNRTLAEIFKYYI